ncbi:MAG: VTT domain-containing protein [Erysipelotrichaceae bacterium]|nr:VTT domain-containing protein [Erysipelotrichaceae bacterium]
MNRNRASNIASIILLISIGVVLIFLLAGLFWQRYGNSIHNLILVLEHGSEQEIENYLRARDFSKGLFLVFLISVFQVVSIIIPGMPIQIAAGSIYGWWGAFLVCYLGFVFANIVIFIIARLLSGKIDLFSRFEAGRKMKERLDGDDPLYWMAMAYLVPGVPNGIIPHVAANSRITLADFLLAVSSTVWIQIALNCAAGYFLVREEYTFMVLSFLLQIGLILLARRNKDKLLQLYSHFRKEIHVD